MVNSNTNHIYRKNSIKKNWVLIDAQDMVLGRIASCIAVMLKGKHKATYAPNMNCGDHVVVVNAEKVHLSGNKLNKKGGKVYHRHTGYPGGIRTSTAQEVLSGMHPQRVIKSAILGMLKKNKLRNSIMKCLHVYNGPNHPHQAQKPLHTDLGIINPKNKKIR